MTDQFEDSYELLEAVRYGPTEEHVEKLDELLDADDPEARQNAISGYRILLESGPELVLEEFDRFVDRLEDPEWGVRNSAAGLLADLGEMDGSAIVEAVPALADRLEDEHSLVRQSALEALRYAAKGDPDAVEPFVEEVFPFLDAEFKQVRTNAVFCLASVSTEHAGRIVPVADELLVRFVEGDDYERIDLPPEARGKSPDLSQPRPERVNEEAIRTQRNLRQAAGHAVYEIAAVEPDAIADSVETLAGLLDDPDPQVRDAAVDALYVLANERPDSVAPHADALAERLADDAEFVDGTAAQALAVLGIEHQGTVVEATRGYEEHLEGMLHRDEPPVRGGAASLFALLADEHPDVIEPVRDRLRELEERDDAEYVRQAAADALSTR